MEMEEYSDDLTEDNKTFPNPGGNSVQNRIFQTRIRSRSVMLDAISLQAIYSRFQPELFCISVLVINSQ